jgi:hypothetical protein
VFLRGCPDEAIGGLVDGGFSRPTDTSPQHRPGKGDQFGLELERLHGLLPVANPSAKPALVGADPHHHFDQVGPSGTRGRQSGPSSSEYARTEKTGALSTRRSELLRAAHYPPIRALVKLSRIDKLLSSFGPTLTELVSPITGRYPTQFVRDHLDAGPLVELVPNTPLDVAIHWQINRYAADQLAALTREVATAARRLLHNEAASQGSTLSRRGKSRNEKR